MLVSAAFALFPPADDLCVILAFGTHPSFCCDVIEAKGFDGFLPNPEQRVFQTP